MQHDWYSYSLAAFAACAAFWRWRRDADIRSLKKNVAELRGKVESLEKLLTDANTDRDTIHREKQALQRQCDAQHIEIEALKIENGRQAEEIKTLRLEVADLSRRLTDQAKTPRVQT